MKTQVKMKKNQKSEKFAVNGILYISALNLTFILM